MGKPKLVRITTVPLSLEKLLEGQLRFMGQFYDVTAISASKERLENFGKTEGVNTFHVEMTRKITPLKDLAAVYKLYRFLRKEKPTIVHTHTPKAGIVGMLAAWLARVPHRLHTVAGLPLMEATGVKRGVLLFVEKLTYGLATKVYPNSTGLRSFILDNNLTIAPKLKIIGNGSSNGINTTYFDPSIFSKEHTVTKRNQLHIPLSDFVFLFVGRLVKDKGVNELVKAFQKVHKKHPKTSLLLVGPLEPDLDPLTPKTLQAMQNHQKIIATGYQKDVRPYFALSQALVFPSYREGFPNVVLQAGAMGLPAIVTNINGCNEIITNNKNGLLIPPKNHNDIERAMLKLIEDKKLVTTLKLNARGTIVNQFKRTQI
ncbi:MAG: glycosyltransferase family 4 protein, partial [Marinirhabdus sp.]